jgi:2,4-dienoyl-CoA reductase-like NADH-dependent reductase (Old Yellow Enzyme family)
MTSLLFSPYTMRGLTLDNRIVLSPMCQYAAAAQDGCATDWHIMHLGQYACSNVGLVITEATGVEPKGRISPWCLGLYSDANQEALARVVRFCKEYGSAKFGVQLAHAGRKASVPPSFMIREPLPPEKGGWTPIAPSYYEDEIHPHPQVMDLEMIEAVKASWVDATRRAGEIGVDLIELHFAHGYLVNEFLSPLINKREDRYGGSRENRMRFGLEIFEMCRKVFPQDRPIGVRISAIDWVEGGWTVEDSCALAAELKQRGCDYICTSSGGVTLAQKITAGPGYQVPFADAVRNRGGIAAMAVGQIWEPQQAEDILQAGQADLIAIGRRLLANPRWAWMAAVHFQQFLKYPPRYRVAHPKMGSTLNFTDTREKRDQLTRMFHAEQELTTKSWG